jgi:ketosteroid isomerase-like protein
MHFTPHILHVSVKGDLAWVVCVEAIQSRHGDREQENQVLATNLFEQRDGRWLMIHHHASPIFRVSGEAE